MTRYLFTLLVGISILLSAKPAFGLGRQAAEAPPPTLRFPFKEDAEWMITEGHNTAYHGGYADPSCGLSRFAADWVRKDNRQAGQPVLAAQEGIVWRRQDNSGSIIIRHADNYFTWYSHMTTNASVHFPDIGDVVAQGQVIGLVGHRGMALGDHLHFALIQWVGTTEPPTSTVFLPSQCSEPWRPVEASFHSGDDILRPLAYPQ